MVVVLLLLLLLLLFVCGFIIVIVTQCLRYNICSAWFLDIRISTCSSCYVHTPFVLW